MRHKISLLLLLAAAPRVALSAETHADPAFVLTATPENFGLYFSTYLANGHFSANTSLRGTDPTLTLLAGLMDYTEGDVSRPAALPSWTEIDYFDGESWLNQSAVTPEAFRDYRQSLDMLNGTLLTRYRWANGSRSSEIAVATFVSQSSPHLGATSLTLQPDFDGQVRLRFTLRSWPAPAHRLPLARLDWPQTQQAVAAAGGSLRPTTPTGVDRAALWYPGEFEIEALHGSPIDDALWIAGRAVGGAKASIAAAVSRPAEFRTVRNQDDKEAGVVTLTVEGRVEKGHSYTFTKFVMVARQDWGGSVEDGLREAKAARASGLAALLQSHQAAWRELWKSDIIVEGDPRLQQAIRSDLFYLFQNSAGDAGWPMAACGFSPHYLGHVFWDNDSWDFPVLLLLHPERAKAQVAFRGRTLPEAMSRARSHHYAGAMYPWESDPVRGTEETPYFAAVNAEREIHVNGDIAAAQWQYYLATGDRAWLRQEGYPVIRETANFWVSRATRDARSGQYEIRHVTSADEEYTDVNNECFTNAIAGKNLSIAAAAANVLGEKPDPRWRATARNLVLPFSEKEQRHLDFDQSIAHDKTTWFASSLVFLTYPPLDLPMSDAVRRNDFNYVRRVMRELAPDANQMATTMIPIQAATVGDTATAYEWTRRNLGGWLKPPFNVRSETAANNTTHFLTGSAGFLQGFLYGFSGLRLTDGGLTGKYPPILPRAWSRIVLRGIAYRGQRYDFVISRDSAGQVSLDRRPAGSQTLRPLQESPP